MESEIAQKFELELEEKSERLLQQLEEAKVHLEEVRDKTAKVLRRIKIENDWFVEYKKSFEKQWIAESQQTELADKALARTKMKMSQNLRDLESASHFIIQRNSLKHNFDLSVQESRVNIEKFVKLKENNLQKEQEIIKEIKCIHE